MVKLFNAAVCPFAQRTRAVLAFLGESYEAVVVDLNDRPKELLELSPTGKVPLLVDGELKLYESDIINDYLVGKYGWSGAYAEDHGLRARQRLAMKQWDTAILPIYYGCLKDPGSFDDKARQGLGMELDELQATIQAMDSAAENMLGLHCAPFWVRMQWLREYVPALSTFEERTVLAAWLSRAAALPAVVQTNPDREETVQAYKERFINRASLTDS